MEVEGEEEWTSEDSTEEVLDSMGRWWLREEERVPKGFGTDICLEEGRVEVE